MGNRFFNELKKDWLKKSLLVFLCGILGCAALVSEKNKTKAYVVKSDNAYVTDIVQFSSGNHKNQEDLFNYKGLLLTTYNLNQFVKNEDIDFTQMNADWVKMTKEQQINWLSKIIKINLFNDGVCEICLDFSKNTPKNIEYLKQNNKIILETFESTSLSTLRTIKPESQIKVINHTEMLPEEIMLPKNKILIKYGIIGFILGIVVSSLAILIRVAGKIK